jgi:hypothetical protein
MPQQGTEPRPYSQQPLRGADRPEPAPMVRHGSSPHDVVVHVTAVMDCSQCVRPMAHVTVSYISNHKPTHSPWPDEPLAASQTMKKTNQM